MVPEFLNRQLPIARFLNGFVEDGLAPLHMNHRPAFRCPIINISGVVAVKVKAFNSDYFFVVDRCGIGRNTYEIVVAGNM